MFRADRLAAGRMTFVSMVGYLEFIQIRFNVKQESLRQTEVTLLSGKINSDNINKQVLVSVTPNFFLTSIRDLGKKHQYKQA